MKRIAILVCNNHASGATHDIDKWETFLTSGEGGAWEKYEIVRHENPSLKELRSSLKTISNQANDFVFVAFAGHGEWKRSTILEINPNGESISETEFNNLASREIVCFDCCRGGSQVAKAVDEAKLKKYSSQQREVLRRMYDDRMMMASPQIVKLYACKIGQCAYGDNDGGYYTNNLIAEATDLLPYADFQTVVRAHNLAAPLTTQETLRKEGKQQDPDIVEGRCSSNNQLIISVSTKMYRIL